MIERIDDPAAVVSLRWVPASDGGRRSGPPTAPVYASTCFFPGESPVHGRGVPGGFDLWSIFVEKQGELEDGAWICAVDFVACEALAPYLRPSAPIVITEGPLIVAYGVVEEIRTSTWTPTRVGGLGG